MARALNSRPRDGLLIDVGWQGDGGVYQLDLRSEERIHEAFPEAVVIGGMLLDYDKTKDYNRFHRPYWEQIARMLTGLTPEQIGRLGGVRIYDPVARKVLWEWHPAATDGQ
jgi:hypothetical protein